MAKWIDQLTPDMLPEQHQTLIDIIGVEATLALCKGLGGESYYIPKLDGALRNARDKLIKEEYDGSNIKELARKYELTTVRIYTILKQPIRTS